MVRKRLWVWLVGTADPADYLSGPTEHYAYWAVSAKTLQLQEGCGHPARVPGFKPCMCVSSSFCLHAVPPDLMAVLDFIAFKIHKGLSYLTLKTFDLDGMLHFFFFHIIPKITQLLQILKWSLFDYLCLFDYHLCPTYTRDRQDVRCPPQAWRRWFHRC